MEYEEELNPRQKGFATIAIHGEKHPYGERIKIKEQSNVSKEVLALEHRLAFLEHSSFCVVFSSVAQATTSILTMLSTSDEVIMSGDEEGEGAMNLRNDIVAVSDLARSQLHNNIIVVVDNTLLMSYYQRPLDLGADISFCSFTNGGKMTDEDDIVCSVALRDYMMHKTLLYMQNLMKRPSIDCCRSLLLDLKTLALRMKQYHKNAIGIARFLEKSDFVEKVNHPFLSSHPQHDVAMKQADGYCRIFTFYTKESNISDEIIKDLEIFSSNQTKLEEGCEREAGETSFASCSTISIQHGNLMRLSIGLEDLDDLIEDLSDSFIYL